MNKKTTYPKIEKYTLENIVKINLHKLEFASNCYCADSYTGMAWNWQLSVLKVVKSFCLLARSINESLNKSHCSNYCLCSFPVLKVIVQVVVFVLFQCLAQHSEISSIITWRTGLHVQTCGSYKQSLLPLRQAHHRAISYILFFFILKYK